MKDNDTGRRPEVRAEEEEEAEERTRVEHPQSMFYKTS